MPDSKSKLSSKTYEEPSNLVILEASSHSWLNLEWNDEDSGACVQVQKCLTKDRKKNFLLTLIGERGSLIVTDGEKITRLYCTADSENALIVDGSASKDGQIVAGITEFGIAFVWDISSFEFPKVLYAVHSSAKARDNTKKVDSVISLSVDGSLLLVNEKDSPIFIWTTITVENDKGEECTSAKLVATLNTSQQRFSNFVTSVCFGEDVMDGYILVGYCDEKVGGDFRSAEACLYRLQGAQMENASSHLLPCAYLRGHESRISSVAFLNDSEFLLTGSTDSRAMGWRMDNQKCNMFLSHPTRTIVQFLLPLSGGAFIITGASDGFVRIWGAYPHFPRSIRGFVPLLARLNPPSSVCKRGAYMVHLSYDQSKFEITVVWRCHETAPSVPEPIADGMEDSYAFVHNETKATLPKGKRPKFSKVLGRLGQSISEDHQNEDAKSTSRFLVTVKYSDILFLKKRWRVDVATLLTFRFDKAVINNMDTRRKLLSLIMQYI